MKTFLLVLSIFPALAMAAHPLVSDDTGTQGNGKWQYEMNTDHGTYDSGAMRTSVSQINATVTFGFNDDVDFALNLPWMRVAPDGLPSANGIGDVALVAKWRIYDKNGWSWALKPQINFPTGDTSQGLGNGKTGAGINGLVSFTSAQWTVLGNIGTTWNNNSVGARTSLWNVSTAAIFSPCDFLKLALDVGTYQNVDPTNNLNPAFMIVGVMWTPNKMLDVDLGVKRGLNRSEVARSIGAGITVHF